MVHSGCPAVVLYQPQPAEERHAIRSHRDWHTGLHNARHPSFINHSLLAREIVVLDQAQNSLRNLPATSNSRLNFVGVIFWLRANEPKINYGEPIRNGFTQNAVVEDVQRRRGQSLHQRVREIGVVDRADR